jgi:hypothetical protein
MNADHLNGQRDCFGHFFMLGVMLMKPVVPSDVPCAMVRKKASLKESDCGLREHS